MIQKRNLKIVVGFLFLTGFLYGCCSCGSDIGENNVVKGYIAVVGNEPFTRLAVMVDKNKVYLLECDKELKDELMKNQGNYYAIQFKDSKYEHEMPVLIVEKATPLKSKQ